MKRIYGSYRPSELKIASRIVRTVRFVKGIHGSWIQLFNRLKSQVVTKWSLEKFVDPYGSYGTVRTENGFRIVRTVRFVKRIDGSWIQLFYQWKNQVVTRWSLEKFVDPYGSYDRANWKWLHGSYEPYGSWKGFTDGEYSFQLVKEAACD